MIRLAIAFFSLVLFLVFLAIAWSVSGNVWTWSATAVAGMVFVCSCVWELALWNQEMFPNATELENRYRETLECIDNRFDELNGTDCARGCGKCIRCLAREALGRPLDRTAVFKPIQRWVCNRCQAMVDIEQKRCLCEIGPSPWAPWSPT